ncbi:histidine phosphatase family protein [Aliiroseovarius sp. YM-037]|uniref:histidine phosphatase family protein n=1 Tax=Aliiroseovarius sp. YM-037 TaxID=3341728 RepID=UPI003A7F7AC2
MPRVIRYLTHPEVLIDPSKDIRSWSLNAVGLGRVNALAQSGALRGTNAIFSSGETKAIETATPLANALGCVLTIRERMHENDRSATGFLPPKEFEAVADLFFAHPDESVRGWETATAAQARIVGEVQVSLPDAPNGDVLFVGHGGVGTLLYCHLASVPISRKYDQTAGGGCFFEFSDEQTTPKTGWRPMAELTDQDRP